MARKCTVHKLGLVSDENAWQLQNSMANEIALGKRHPTLLLLEHPHTFTFGRRGQLENLLWDETELARRGVSVQWVDRGGDVTYHGPGQLVGYPILPLKTDGLHVKGDSSRLPQADYVGYVRKLELTLITALAHLGVAATQVEGLTGVWTQAEQSSGGGNHPSTENQDGRKPGKVAAIGVKVDARGVSRHGFALNVNPDMSYWEGIIACGLATHPVTSLADFLAPVPSMGIVMNALIFAFGNVYNYEMFEEPL